MIIGILGKKYNGKDTIADHLVKKYGFKKIAFADPVKDMCRLLFGFNERQLYGDLKEVVDSNWGVSPRTVMQYLGTDVFRRDINKIMPHIKENFWINCVRTRYLNMLKEDPKVLLVISDVRFANEVDIIHELKGPVFKVERDVVNSNDIHESEKNIDLIKNYDYLISNNKSVQDLYDKIDSIIKNYI